MSFIDGRCVIVAEIFRVRFVLKINYWLHSDELNIQASKFYDLITTFMRGNIVVNDLMLALFCRQS